MNSHLKFLRRVRIHGGECGAVARALHHEVKTLSLPAVEEKVSFTTNERKSMNKKTSFKRIALAVVATLGFGVLSTGPTQAVPFSHTLTIDSATDSVFTFETATAVLTNIFSSNVGNESTTIRYTCTTAAGNSCPVPVHFVTPSSDTSNVYMRGSHTADDTASNTYGANGIWVDSIVSLTAPARSVTSVKAVGFSAPGTYTYSFYTTYKGLSNSNPSTDVLTGQSVTWTVTVAGAAERQSAATARIYISADGNSNDGSATAFNAWKTWAATSTADSAIVVDKGSTTPAIVGVAFIRPYNTAGDTAVAVVTGGTKNSASTGTVDDSITVEVSGPGYVSSNTAPTTSGNYGKSAIVNAQNKVSTNATESITILSDGTAGVATITFKNRSNVVLGTKTVTFTGGIASISQAFFVNGETTVSYSGTRTTLDDTVTISAYVKDSAGTIVKSSGGLDRNLYLYSSDTAVVGDINGASLPTGRVSACTIATATGLWTCKGDIRDSGTVTLTLRDSITVTASTVSFDLGTVTVVGNTLKTMTAAYDKATYAPGERAVLTIKGLDTQGKVLSGRASDSGTMNKTYASAWTLVNISPLTHTVSATTPYIGTTGTSYTATTYSPFKETGMETVVVTMPTTSGVVTYEFRNSLGVAMATISATVVNPQDALIAAATAAAEAATDAAAEAIDAANAATDASNLAAEAADAATVAAEEARDAADAATAAVEELATQVATLMAALKAQLTTLANTVAKIAKKVKA